MAFLFYIPSNFLIIGYLKNLSDVDIRNYCIKITPISHKFLEFMSSHKKIVVYIKNIINDNIDLKDMEDFKIYHHYMNDIFVIRPSYYKDSHENTKIVGDDKCVYIIDGNKIFENGGPRIDYLKHNLFTPIPIFNKKTTTMSVHNRYDFERALSLNGTKKICEITVAPWPKGNSRYPHCIIWQENANEYYLYTHVISQRLTIKTHKSGKYNKFSEQVSYKFKGNKINPHKITKKKLINNSALVYQNQIAFISLDFIEGFHYELNNNKNVNNITNNSSDKKSEGISLYSPIDAFNHTNKTKPTKQNNDTRKGKNNSIQTKYSLHNVSKNEHKTNNDTNKASKQTGESLKMLDNLDAKFIKKLEYLTYNNKPRLYYRLEDLINFHTAMKCNGLVVLAGLSGTGKSALIELYARALGLTRNKNLHQFKFIPVRPFWNDDSDLLGYVDTVHSIYQPADSGLINTLVEASKNPDHLYLITFDEMNLARVEYYFSQFLSILEKNPDNRYIQLYNPDLESRLYNSSKYKSRIKIGRNVLFTGTINLDESTHKFSDKVLDRSNIINLKLVPYYLDNKKSSNIPNRNPIDKEITPKDFNQMRTCNSDNKLTTKDLKMLWEIHKTLHQANNNLGIGRRIVNQINQYLCGIPKLNNEPLTHGKALDLQLVQRVFTKLRGSSADIGDILKPENNHSNNLIHILNNYADISDFTESKNELKRKYNEVRNYGFTI